MTVRIQELDGTFNHTVQVEEKATKINLSCHSRARRNKKKKIPLLTAEEVDLDLSQSDQDSPLLWLRPELQNYQSLFLKFRKLKNKIIHKFLKKKKELKFS